MINLNDNEYTVWQMNLPVCILVDYKTFEIKYFVLTNFNIRIQYWYTQNTYSKFINELIIPLDSILYENNVPKINTLYNYENNLLMTIFTTKNEYKFKILNRSSTNLLDREINDFKKNIFKLHNKCIHYDINSDKLNIVNNSYSTNPDINSVDLIQIKEFLILLGASPVELNNKNTEKIYKLFPVPKEHNIIWADAEFDLRCSGIVCTNKGCFIKTNVNPIEDVQKNNDIKSELYYFKWEIFESSWFTQISDNNYVLKVDKQCQNAFLNACKNHNQHNEDKRINVEKYEKFEFNSYVGIVTGISSGVTNGPNANLDFIQKYIRNVNGRNGFFAEQANNMHDIRLGRRASVIGGNNLKDGADRLIDYLFKPDEFIQTKYYKTASATLNSAFDSNGFYRYVNDKTGIMRLEVPKEQYESVVEGFAEKIRLGKVIDQYGNVVKDPELAKHYVRKGHYTFEQSMNAAKAGNIDSLIYDAQKGMVRCKIAFGISFLLTMYTSYKKHGSLEKAFKDGLNVGVKVFGLTMINHILISQLYRIPQFYEYVGNVPIRNMLTTSAVSMLVYSIPNFYKLIRNKISATQFLKNTAVVGAGIAGGSAGSLIGGKIGEQILGTPGKIIGSLFGGFLGAAGASKLVKTGTDIIKEDDLQIFSRIYSATISSMVIDYMLDEKEVSILSNRLSQIDEKSISDLYSKYRNSQNQEAVLIDFLKPIFEYIIYNREKFSAPTNEAITKGFLLLS